jgi:queuine tRNA-ribosyltransferase
MAANSVFKITATDSGTSARTAELKTAHGIIRTPVFMPVGTRGSVKGIPPERLELLGSQIILANTYHMLTRPGIEIVEKIGGLHKLMAWQKAILTDSGGYQVFSLSSLRKIDDNGIEFNSHVDGQLLKLDPELATNAQNRLGADIIMALDQCTGYPCPANELETAVKRTIKWAKRCKMAHQRQKDQHLFAIVQGEVNLEQRARCAKELVDLDFPGYAIGGLSVGEGHENMAKVTRHTAPLLPEKKPRYLMGAGTPADIIAAVAAGIDMFDCVLPTRNGRNAYAFTENGPIRLRNSVHLTDTKPVEIDCDCYCCRCFSRAAIRHFFNVNEMLGPILLSIHNIRFYHRLLARITEKINKNEFTGWAAEKIKYYRQKFENNEQNKKIEK